MSSLRTYTNQIHARPARPAAESRLTTPFAELLGRLPALSGASRKPAALVGRPVAAKAAATRGSQAQ